MQAEAARAEAAAAAAPAQNQMAAPAAPTAPRDQAPPDQIQAEVLQLCARIFQAVRPGHAHAQ